MNLLAEAPKKRFLYHYSDAEKLPDMLRDGVKPLSYWGEMCIAMMYRDSMYRGNRPIILRVPMGRFDPAYFEPDQRGIEYPPSLHVLSMCRDHGMTSSDEIGERWAAIDNPGWEDSLNLIGSVSYRGIMPIRKADVWRRSRSAIASAGFLGESMNHPAPWQWTKTDAKWYRAEFAIHDLTYWVHCYLGNWNGEPCWTFDFGITKESAESRGETSLTGPNGYGNAMLVLSTVKDVFDAFISDHRPKLIIFYDSDSVSGRGKMYDKFASYLESRCGYSRDDALVAKTIRITGKKVWALRKRQLNEATHDGVITPLSEATGGWLYHGTISRHFRSIYMHGLRAGGEMNWNFSENPQGVVYLANSEAQANYYASAVAANQYYRLGASSVPYVVMLRVPMDARLKIVADPHTHGDYYTARPIPVSKIEVKLHDQWHKLGQVNRFTVDAIADGDWDDPPEDEYENEAP